MTWWIGDREERSMLTAIVLKREDIREYDQRITLYTRERGLVVGKISGVKKIVSKQSPRLEIGVLAKVQIVPGKQGERLITSEPIEMFRAVRTSYKKSLCVQYILGLVAQTVKSNQADPALFDFLKQVMIVYNNVPEKQCAEVLRRALWCYLEILGYRSDKQGDLKSWHRFAQYQFERKISNPVLSF